MLDAVAPQLLVEDVDLRALEERARRLVVRELRLRARIPHHDRLEAGAGLAGGIDVGGVELDLPHLLEAQDVLEPEQHRLHRLEVRGDVIDVANRTCWSLHLGQAGPGTAPHPETAPRNPAIGLAKTGTCSPERRGDRELAQRAAVIGEGLDVLDRRTATLLDQRERPLASSTSKINAPTPSGCFARKRCARPPVPSGELHTIWICPPRSTPTSGAALLELGRRPPGLGKVELGRVELPRALEVADVPVNAFEAL